MIYCGLEFNSEQSRSINIYYYIFSTRDTYFQIILIEEISPICSFHVHDYI